ncbi:MAG: metallophosphoesterase [Planctomycetaceae bacterium]|nr:metallophosphoesterase [Planctomycetaceae bacterium]
MRILITADLHYDIARSRAGAEDLARRALEAGGDALVLVGDTAGSEPAPWQKCLALFQGFPGMKLIVPGNHCLWCRHNETSIQRYYELLPALAAEAGFVVLDHHPQIIGDVGLVGSVGWYDYSMADPALGIPEAFYEAKLSPGAAAHIGQDDLVEAHRDALTQRQMEILARWMDGHHVRLGMSDKEFVQQLSHTLETQLKTVAPRVKRIVAFMHHLPFAQQVPPDRPDRFAFAAAYMGAARFGQVLLACRKVTHVYCGHSHWPDRRKIGRLTVVNIGSTYVEKKLETLEL